MVASHIILLLFMNIVKSYGDIGTSEFEDLQGNRVNIKEYCKDKYCVPKCCPEKEILFEQETAQATCGLHDAGYEPATTIPVYNSLFGKKQETKDKIVFVRKTKFYRRTFTSQIHTVNFYINENDSSLRTESSGNVTNTEMKYYCLDQIYKKISDKGATSLKYAAVTLSASLICEDKLVEWESGRPIDLKKDCKEPRCIVKCCSLTKNMFVVNINDKKVQGCFTWDEIKTKFPTLSNLSVNIDYSKIEVYNNDYENCLRKNTTLQSYKFIKNYKATYSGCMALVNHNHSRFLENGSFIIDRINYRKRFVMTPVDFNDYCFEHFVQIEDNKVSDPLLVIRSLRHDGASVPLEDYTSRAIAMLMSCVFIIATLIVYGVIRELRNINGIILMAYLTTLAATFILKAYQLLGSITMESCKPFSAVQYYLAISTFFWMNIMSLDIWWTFRGMFKWRPIHRQGELVKFWWYALYAWGAPLLIAITATVIDYKDLSHIPQLFKPHFESCFFQDTTNDEIWYYMYLPILILLVVNLIFFLMTSFNVWRIKMSMSRFTNEAKKYNNNQNRFGLYLKLSMVMGISWIFDAFDLPPWLQTPASYYNALIGVAVFIVFVLKRKILFLLCKRAPPIEPESLQFYSKQNSQL